MLLPKKIKTFVAVILLIALFVPAFFSVYPPVAYAQSLPGLPDPPKLPGLPGSEGFKSEFYDGPSFEELFEKYAKQCAKGAVIELVAAGVLGFFSGTQVPTAPWPDLIKEAIKDCLVNATKFALLEIITGQSVGWAQKGYGGNPSFVQNIGQYLAGIADNVAGRYIAQTAAGDFLCSPFRSQIQLALTRSYQASRYGSGIGYGQFGQSSCTLSQVASNVDAFLGGDFYSGGWEAWIAMSANPYNTSYGAYLMTSAELSKKIEEQTAEAQKKLDFGSGFLSKEVQTCYGIDELGYKQIIDPDDIGAEGDDFVEYECDPPQVVTPGETVKSSLEKSFGVKLDTIVSADELNEIISLVAAFLLNEILTEDEGVSGYSYKNQFAKYGEPIVINDWNDYTNDGGGSGGDACGTGPYVEPQNSGNPGSPNPIRITESGVLARSGDTEHIFSGSASPDGRYSRVQVEFDVTVGEWNYHHAGGVNYHDLMWIVRGVNAATSPDKWTNNVIGEIGFKAGAGPGDPKKLVISHNMDYPAYGACQIGRDHTVDVRTGNTYRVTFVYETGEGAEKGIWVEFDGPGDNDFGGWVGQEVPFIDIDNARGGQVNSSGVSGGVGGGTHLDEYQVPLGPGWEFSNLSVEVSHGGSGGGTTPGDPSSGSGNSGSSGGVGSAGGSGNTDPKLDFGD